MSITKCIYCGSDKVRKEGKPRGKQQFLCTGCHKYFIPEAPRLTFVRPYLPRLIPLILQDTSVREIAKILKINHKTAHRWRLKVLEKLQRPKIPVKKVTIIDETYLRDNQKGNREIEGRRPRKRGLKKSSPYNLGRRKQGQKDPQTAIMFAVSDGDWYGQALGNIGGLKKVDLERVLELPKTPIILSEKPTLYSDRHSAIRGFAKDHKKEMKFHGQSGHFKQINLVNNVHMHFKAFVVKYHGLSTKHMNKYVHLFLLKKKYFQASAEQQKEIVRNLIKQF
jgi:transposase-like protein